MVDYKKGQTWNKPKSKIMLKFEKETNKSAVFRGKITGQFEYWLWQEQKKLQKQLNVHWKATEKKRKQTHTGKIYKKHLKIKEEREKQQEALTFLRKSQVKIQQYLKEPDYSAAKTRLVLAKRRLPYLIDDDIIKKWTKKIELLEKEINKKIKPPKKIEKNAAKQQAFEKRKIILDQLYETLFLTTKDLADILGVSTKEAYSHAKWLENHDLVAGQASAGTGVSTPRGTYRTLSILWEPYYHRESYQDIEFKEVVKILKKEMKI